MLFLKNKRDRHVLFEKKGWHSVEMKLIYLGKYINTCKEQNIESEDEFGFDVTIIYKETSWISRASKIKIYNEKLFNCTQVHYGYTEIGTVDLITKIAFESDIHSTGFNREISDIESVKITLSNEMHADYHRI